MSKAFGFAALRVGYAVAAPEVARCWRSAASRRPSPARPPGSPQRRCVSRGSTSSRSSPSASGCERRCSRRATTCRRRADELRLRPHRRRAALADRLESQGLVVRTRRAAAIRITLRGPSDDDLILRALGAEPGPPGRALGDGDPDDDRDGAAHHARPRRERPGADRDGDRLSRPPADAPGVPRRLRPGGAGRRRSRRRRAPHRRGRARVVRRRPDDGARRRARA